jgi:hypothetical protein
MSDDPSHLHRRNDPDTSVEAAGSAARRAGVDRRRVWRYAVACGDDGYTHKELERAMAVLLDSERAKEISTYRSRSNDLVLMGMVIDTGRRRQNLPSKRNRIVWRALTPSELEEAAANAGGTPLLRDPVGVVVPVSEE